MGLFNWKELFDSLPVKTDSKNGFDRYHIRNETGNGTITTCIPFSGIQVLHSELHMLRCNRPVKQNKNVIVITLCLDGRFEYTVNSRRCFYVSAGDFSLSLVEKERSGGLFPTGRFHAISIILEPIVFSQHHAEILQNLNIRLEQIHTLASKPMNNYVIHHNPYLDKIRKDFLNGFEANSIPFLKIKVMELLLFLSSPDAEKVSKSPIYLNNNNIALAESVHKLLVTDLSRRITIEQLAAELGTGITSIKKAFKNVYGVPVYKYYRDLRLQEAQRLLRETELSVSSIASSVGYLTPAKFSSAFKDRFGVTPTEYKRNAKVRTN